MKIKQLIYCSTAAIVGIACAPVIGMVATSHAPVREVGITPLDTIVGNSPRYGKTILLPNVPPWPRNGSYTI